MQHSSIPFLVGALVDVVTTPATAPLFVGTTAALHGAAAYTSGLVTLNGVSLADGVQIW